MMKKLTLIALMMILAGAFTFAGTVEQAANDFVDLLAKKNFDEAEMRFDATMTKLLPAERLEQIWKDLQGQMGAFQKRQSVRKEKYGEYDIVFVTCKFANTLLDVKVVYNKDQQIAGLYFVPAKQPAAPAPYVSRDAFTEKDVVVGVKEWPLPGTLAMPKGDGPFPAVILVHGSGPNDRDETVGPNKPFRDLARGLASNGIAVLRYEKRTRQHATKLKELANRLTVYEETIEDALAAVPFLKATASIDKNKIYILGHSLGAYLAPRMAMKDKENSAAGFIICAGPTRALEDLVLEQFNYIFSLDNTITDEEKQTLAKLEKQVALAKSSGLSPKTPAADLPLGVPAAYWLDLRGYQPAQTAKKITRPLLILQGERDYQVTMTDFKGWQEALSGKKNVVFKAFPGLNHLFIKGSGKSSPSEYETAGHVDKSVIDTIIDWIKKR